MVSSKKLQKLAVEHGTPLMVIDHDELCANYRMFHSHLPRVKIYYAVKANPDKEIVRTFYKAGAGFDVASWEEFQIVYENIKNLPKPERQNFIWDKIIYANPIKANDTLRSLAPYKPLVTFDNFEEITKIKTYAPNAGLVLRINVPNTGSVVELASKFGASPGEAVDLILLAEKAGLTVEGISFHVGSQCTNFENYIQALNISANVFQEASLRGVKLKLLDIGGGFPAPYNTKVLPFSTLASYIGKELDRLFPSEIEIIAEPGRFLVASAGTLVASVIGKAIRNGKTCYYIDDGIYGAYSGVLFDHCYYPVKAFKKDKTQLCSVFGPTCDALDRIGISEELPDLQLGALVYSENIGAYSIASATNFNGFKPAKVVHVNLTTN